MLDLEQGAGQLVFPSTQLLEQSSYNLMKLFQPRIPVVVISKTKGDILSQSNPRRDIFDNV